MKKITFCFLLIVQIFVACSKTGSATATIRVMVGNPPTPQIPESVKEIFTSYDLAQHANKTLGLTKLWGGSEMDANKKVMRSISVRTGGEPGLFLIEANDFDHELAVKIINDLCTNACSLDLLDSVNGGPEQKVQMSIMQAAK